MRNSLNEKDCCILGRRELRLFQNCSKTLCCCGLGGYFEREADNSENWTEGMEGLDGAIALGKQVLSQLSYTPAVTL